MEPFDGAPVVVPSGDGRLELFVFGLQDGRLWHAWQGQWSNSTDWLGWCDMGLSGSWPATVAANGDGTLVLVVLNAQSQLSYAAQTAWSNGWSAWTPLPPVPDGSSFAPGVAADADGRLQLFVASGSLYVIPQSGWSNGWAQWQDLGVPGGGAAAVYGPVTAGRSGDGRIEAFVADSQGSLWNYRQTAPGSAFSGANAFGNPGVALDDRPALVRSADGRLELFVRGQDNLLYHQWETAVGTFTWSGWNSFDADTAPEFGFTDHPVVAASADGRLELFLTGGDGNLYHSWQTAASNGWSGWVNEGTAGGGFTGVAPGLARNGDGRLQVFEVARDGNVYHKWQTVASSGWGPWTLLSPGAPPPPTTTVPDVIDLKVSFAQAEIQAAQLHMNPPSGAGQWVVNQSPAGGTLVPVGSGVSVILGANPP